MSEILLAFSCLIIFTFHYPNKTKLAIHRFFFLYGFILLVVTTSQFDGYGDFFSAEHNSHFEEMRQCIDYQSLQFLELFKSVFKFIACYFSNPYLFDLLYKLTFAILSFVLCIYSPHAYVKNSPFRLNPSLPILFTAYPLIYGNVRSALASLSIVLVFFPLLNFISAFYKYLFKVQYLVFYLMLLLLPLFFHSVGITLVFLLLLILCLPLIEQLYRQKIGFFRIFVFAIVAFMFASLYLSLGSSEYLIGKNINFYLGNEFDVKTIYGLPVSTIVVFSLPYILCFSPFGGANVVSSRVINNLLVSFNWSVLALAIPVSFIIASQVAARIIMLFTPLQYLLYSSALANRASFKSYVFAIISVLVLFTLAYSESEYFTTFGLPFITNMLF